MHRISLVGPPGSGKTTLGLRVADVLDLPFIELDAIVHQRGWAELPSGEFRRRVDEAIQGPGWVVDGNYGAVRDLVWDRADTVIWLDVSRAVVMRRIIGRTVRRAVTRQELWNGNREPLSNFYRWDPEKNIIRWAWIMYPDYVEGYGMAMADPANAHLRFVRLTSPRAIDAFMASRLTRQGPELN